MEALKRAHDAAAATERLAEGARREMAAVTELTRAANASYGEKEERVDDSECEFDSSASWVFNSEGRLIPPLLSSITTASTPAQTLGERTASASFLVSWIRIPRRLS